MDKWMGRWLVGGCSDVNTLTLRLAEASKPFTEAEKNYSKITSYFLRCIECLLCARHCVDNSGWGLT